MSHLLLLVPFAALVLVNLLPRSARAAATGIAFFVLAAQAVVVVLQPLGAADWSFLAPLSRAIGFDLSLDNLSVLMLLSAGLAGMASLLAAGPGLSQRRERFLFANLVLVALIGINGISLVRDLFSLYVFIEVTAVATFILVTIRHGVDAFEGAWKYLILSAVASVLMLSSIALYLLVEGGASLEAVRQSLASPAAHTLDLPRRFSSAGFSSRAVSCPSTVGWRTPTARLPRRPPFSWRESSQRRPGCSPSCGWHTRSSVMPFRPDGSSSLSGR